MLKAIAVSGFTLLALQGLKIKGRAYLYLSVCIHKCFQRSRKPFLAAGLFFDQTVRLTLPN